MRTMPLRASASAVSAFVAVVLPAEALDDDSADAGGLSGCALELVQPEMTRASRAVARSGAERLVACAREAGLAPGETRADGAVTVEQVFCLGNCALGPSVEADGRLYGRVDPARLGALLDGRTSS